MDYEVTTILTFGGYSEKKSNKVSNLINLYTRHTSNIIYRSYLMCVKNISGIHVLRENLILNVKDSSFTLAFFQCKRLMNVCIYPFLLPSFVLALASRLRGLTSIASDLSIYEFILLMIIFIEMILKLHGV